MLPIQVMFIQAEEEPPEGYAFVVTNTGKFVTTAYSTQVIAKDYV
jgi:hypothetical protein